MSEERPRNLPLAGVRVADFCWAVAGPVTTKFLAMMGAEVIKVESRSRLDGGRLGTPFLEGKPGVNKSGYFANHNMSKLSIRLDMTKDESRAIAKRLISTSDIVSESFSAGVIGRWGMGYEDLVKVKPDLIMISLTMQGQTGPHATHVGFGRTLQGLAGIDHLTGWPDKGPSGPNQPYTDLVVPWFATTALAAALRHRDQTGRGQYIDLAQLETALHVVAPPILDYSANGRVQTRDGNRSESAAPHGVYPCRGEDRWCVIAVTSDAHWRNLCHAIGRPELEHDGRFATLLRRKAHEPELDETVAAWTSPLEPDEAVERLHASGVPAGVVARGEDMHRDRQLKARETLLPLEHPVMGLRTYTQPSFRMSETPARVDRAPLLGEQSDYVYSEVLGMPQAQIDELRNVGVLN